MVFRGNISMEERLIGSSPYFLPMLQSLPFGLPVLMSFPAGVAILRTLIPLFQLLEGNFIISLAVFFGLFLLVVRNAKISRFIRFNTMQSLILMIALSLISIIFSTLNLGQLSPLLSPVIFLVNLGICGFAIVQNLRGLYPEIPTISDAAYVQIRY